MGIKGVAEIDGKEVDVELKSVKDLDGHFTKEQADARTEGAIRERLKNHKTPEQLMDDEGFTKKFFEKHGIDPNDKGKKLSPEEITRLRDTFRKEEVEPLQTNLSATTERLTKRERKQIESDLHTSLLEAGFKKPIAAKLAKMHAGEFGIDEHDNTSLRDGDGFSFSASATKGAPYQGSAEWAKKLAADPDNADFLEKRSTQTSPAPDGKRAAGAKNIQLTRADAQNRQKFNAAHAEAKKLGVDVEVDGVVVAPL